MIIQPQHILLLEAHKDKPCLNEKGEIYFLKDWKINHVTHTFWFKDSVTEPTLLELTMKYGDALVYHHLKEKYTDYCHQLFLVVQDRKRYQKMETELEKLNLKIANK